MNEGKEAGGENSGYSGMGMRQSPSTCSEDALNLVDEMSCFWKSFPFSIRV